MALPDYSMRQLLEAGVHFGHQSHRWNPKMREFIFGARNNIHIIDLAQTVPLLHQALKTVSDTVAKGGRVLFVKTEEIDWIEAEGCYARLHTGRQSHLLRETMSALEAQLDQQTFLRIHRSTIINRDRIRELLPQSHGEYSVVLQDGTQLRLSRSYRDKLSALLG